MLLFGILLSCGTLCLMSSMPLPTTTGCNASSLLQETLIDVQRLKSKGGGKIIPPNNMTEAGGNVTTYLEKFTEILNATKRSWKERRIALKLKKIQDAGKSCPGWMEQEWEPVKEEDFFSSLERLLRFLNHYALPEGISVVFKGV